MLTEEHGNLLEAPADALVNTVNTVGIMGKGLALQFKQAYPGTSMPTSPPAATARCIWAGCSRTRPAS
jgi:O-acetyl-ADP-ribose deacetylase (regulator of RNase III)